VADGAGSSGGPQPTAGVHREPQAAQATLGHLGSLPAMDVRFAHRAAGL